MHAIGEHNLHILFEIIVLGVSMIEEEVYIHSDIYYFNIVKNNIKKARQKSNLSQQQLADKAGITRVYLSQIESENIAKYPTIAVVGRIADALNIKIKDLFEE